ncbi:MAG: hypothetical protein II689_03910 [Firmicutes bacterium]|nr:hypothetical protein [Bacillota bacterium]
MATILSETKNAMRLTKTEYDPEISRLIDAACADLCIAGITATSETEDPILIMAIIIFLMVKGVNKLRNLNKKKEEEEEAATTKKCPFCCSEIDIEATKCPHCTSDLTK